jgi:hypothetical protein
MNRTQDEIEDQLNKASESLEENPGGRWPGMSYEDGVKNTLYWILGESDDLPMEDD